MREFFQSFLIAALIDRLGIFSKKLKLNKEARTTPRIAEKLGKYVQFMYFGSHHKICHVSAIDRANTEYTPTSL